MDRGFLIGTALAAALTFGGVLFLTAPAASTNPAPVTPAAIADLPAPIPESDPPMEAPEAATRAYYANCNDARAAGAAPIYRGQPGYREEMDGDSDGIACEPYHGMRGIRVPRRVR